MSYTVGTHEVAPGVTVDVTRTVDTADEAIAWLTKECEYAWDNAYEEIGGLSDDVFLDMHTALHNHNLAFTKVFEKECNGVLYYARENVNG